MIETPVALPVRGTVVFPGMLRALTVARPSSIRAIEKHIDEGASLVLVAQTDAAEDDPTQAQIARVAIGARVLRIARVPDGSVKVLVEGLGRVRVAGPVKLAGDVTLVGVSPLEEDESDPIEVAALAKQLASMYEEYMVGTGVQATDHQQLAADRHDPERLADQIAGLIDLDPLERIAVLEEVELQGRLELLVDLLATNIAQQRISVDVNSKVQAAMDQSQREYHLKEQLKAIRAELGDAASSEADADEFERRIQASAMPEDARKEALREVGRLRRIQSDSAEYNVTRTWLETVCDIPWGVFTADTTSLEVAETVLDEDHHGLAKVKERILEYLAVRQLQPRSKGAILCFAGAPGVGKTSLGRSIARALGRKYARVSLGGIKDETEIRGHRRTYIGALPGRIVRAIIQSESMNPVIVLDELDKVGNDFRGDPASALLEALDPEQNNAFVDHYLDVGVDLSQVLFIATANLIDPIPPALQDRLEIIEIPGYTHEEKLAIAARFLLPRLAADHGIEDTQIHVTQPALNRAIIEYTREAGVRDLKRQLATVHRKVARQFVEGRKGSVSIGADDVPKYLGPQRYFEEVASQEHMPGVVVGLAWTAAGGDVLFVEAARMPGQPGLKLTGSLGDVMKESAEAAMSWLRSNASRWGIEKEVFQDHFHLHVPAGAIPKDGPSAGITMVTALASLITGRPVKARVAMTGEITLRGRVLPVGGVKEKVLAARRAGITDILLPRNNRNDLIDIPKVLRRDLTFHYVEHVSEVLNFALTPAADAEAAAGK